MAALIWILIIGGIVFFIAQAIKIKAQQEAEDRTFFGEHGGWDIYRSPYDRGILALDHDGRRIAVGKVGGYVEASWGDIAAVEIEKNGQSIVQTNRGAQVMGAAVGAVLLGPVGLLVGSLSGSKRQRERVNELSLKILVDYRQAPVHRITFFRMNGNGADPKGVSLKKPAAQLEHFHALISNAIRSDDRQHRPDGALQIQAANSGEQIAKLWDLKLAGALTEEEYLAEKRVVLSRPDTGPGPSGDSRQIER